LKLLVSNILIGLGFGCVLAWPIPMQAADTSTIIVLERAVHFTGSGGGDVLVDAGTYDVRTQDEYLELHTPAGGNTIALQSGPGRHELKLPSAIAVSIPGYTEDEADYQYVALLLPGGRSLEATGTYSGIQSRGLLDKPRPGLQQALSRAKQIPHNIKAGVGQIKDSAQQFAQIQRCQLMVNAIKVVRLFPENLARVNEGRSKQGELAKWRQSMDIKQQIKDRSAQVVERYQHLVPELKRIHQWLNSPQNQAAVEDLFSVDTLCKAGPAEIEAKLSAFGLRPNVAGPANDAGDHFYIGLSKGVTAAALVGVVASRQIVTDFRGNTMRLLTVGPAVVSNATVSATGEVMFYPSTNRAAFGGWSSGLGVSGGFPGIDIGAAVDFAFGSKPAIIGNGFVKGIMSEFQGFGLGPTVGLSLVPVDGTNSYAYTWELPGWVP
jgi:hypothetical protein